MDTTFRPSLLSDSHRGRWLSSTLAMALHGTVAVAAVVGIGFDPSPVDVEPHVVVELVAVAAPVPVAAPEPPAPMPPAPMPPAPPTPASKPTPPPPLPKAVPKAAMPVKNARPTLSEPAPPSAPDAVAEAPATDSAPAVAASGPPTADAPPPAHPAPVQQAYSPPVGRAGYLSNPRPAYPMLARKRGWEGMVTLLVEVAADGHPVSVEIKRSSGHSVLDNCAVAAVRQWRFQPARRGGSAVTASVEVPIRFDLQEGT